MKVRVCPHWLVPKGQFQCQNYSRPTVVSSSPKFFFIWKQHKKFTVEYAIILLLKRFALLGSSFFDFGFCNKSVIKVFPPPTPFTSIKNTILFGPLGHIGPL